MSQAPHTLLFLLLQVFQAPYQEARTPYNKYFRPQPLLSHNLLSAQEVAQGYKDVKERSAIVRFKVKEEDAYILAWTTTPWTLPSAAFTFA